jgi:hypothetical protein
MDRQQHQPGMEDPSTFSADTVTAAIVGSAADAIIAENPYGIVLLWNRGAEQLSAIRPTR